MTINIIIGKHSNLSEQLYCKLENAHLVSSRELDSLDNIAFEKYEKVNIIFNQFQPSTKLYLLDSPIEYIDKSIKSTAEVLEHIKANKIKVTKIIYTSSSSVYGNNTACSEDDDVHPMSLHASLKVANEKLIEKFCLDNDIDYTIARIFNMYGGNDKFSIISKIINIYKNSETLTLINNGEAIRDFVHIDDVVYCYKKILETQNKPVVNIGTSEGKSILYILNYLQKHHIELNTKEITQDELKVSICKNKELLMIIGDYSFKKVEEYILKSINSDK